MRDLSPSCPRLSSRAHFPPTIETPAPNLGCLGIDLLSRVVNDKEVRFSVSRVLMNALRLIFALVIAAGVLLCPYRCIAEGCGQLTSAVQVRSGCCCKNCHPGPATDDLEAAAVPADDGHSPGQGQTCDCVCDGALGKVVQEESVPTVPELAFGVIVYDQTGSANFRHETFVDDRSTRSHSKDGRATRILLQTFLI